MARPEASLLDLAAGRPVVVGRAEALVSSALEHRMTGLLLAETKATPLGLSAQQQRLIAANTLATRAHHQRLWAALDHAIERLGDAGFEVAMLKGVTAEREWYDRSGDRPCGDLDLLLRPDQATRAAEVVRLLEPDHHLLPHLDQLVAHSHLQSVDVKFDGVYIDLHFDPFKLGIPLRHPDVVWNRTRTVTSPGGRNVLMLDAETSLVLFLLHLLKDRLSYLLGFVDVLRIMEKEQLDWAFLDDFVRSEGLEVLVYTTLETVYDTLGLVAPAHPASEGWRAWLWHRLWPAEIRLDGHPGRIAHHRRQFAFPFLMPGREWDGVKALVRLAFPPKTLMDHYHPDTSGPYPWRLVLGRLHRRAERKRSVARRRAATTLTPGGTGDGD